MIPEGTWVVPGLGEEATDWRDRRSRVPQTAVQEASAAAAETDYRIMGQCEARATVPANDNTIANSGLAIRWIYEI